MTRARAPGKVVISGAYAVLSGAPAISSAVSRYVIADTARPAELLTDEVRAALSADESAPWFDASVWVQSDEAQAYRRGIERDIVLGRDRAEAVAFWDEWMAHEGPFLAADRPWERADVVICSTPVPAVPDGVVAVSRARAVPGAPAARTS